MMDTYDQPESYEKEASDADASCGIAKPHHHTAVPGDVWHARAREALVRDGYRLTMSRKAVLHQIAATPAPFTAEQLVVALHEGAAGGGSRPTVYRLVHWLRTNGWLARVYLDSPHSGYTRQLPGHDNVVCVSCGDTLLIGGWNLEALLAPSLIGTGFEVQGHVMELYGRCGTCRRDHPAQAAGASA